MAKTTAPTGLSITRNDTSFTFSWKIADSNYDGGQNFYYRVLESGVWQSFIKLPVLANDTSKVVTIDNLHSKYYPNSATKFGGIQFGVNGIRSGYNASDYTYFPVYFYPPEEPSLSSTVTNTNLFRATFSVSEEYYKKIFTKFEWQSILVSESDETNGGALNWSSEQDGWQTGTMSRNTYSVSITEDTSVISYGSHTRWFRVRSQGPAGDSNWVYTKHVYASPSSAEIIGADARPHSSGFILDMTWKALAIESRPIDEVAVQYAKAIPIADMLPPANPSWQTAITAMDTTGNDSASVNISGGLEDDQCLFARVMTTHDNRNSYSDVVLVRKGVLATPSGLTVTVSNNSATVRATNNSSACVYNGSDTTIKRQFMGIIYKSTMRYTSGVIVGIIPKSQNQAVVTIPERLDGEEYTIEVQAFVGTYHGKTNTEGVTIYTVFAEMTSESISTEGATPKAPEDLQAEVLNGTDIRLSWVWSWDKADGIEISWSQDEDAWQSNSQPEAFIVNGYAVNWLIKGLETGKRYYLKARFKYGEDYSPYSNTIDFVMSTAPTKPMVNLSSSTIAKSGSVVVSWNYSPTDGSEQSYAELVSNGQIIAHSLTEKHIKIYAENIGWTDGTHDLKLRVKSSSGMFSDYSDTVYIAIAPELSAVISNTSLETISIVEDGKTRQALSLTELPLTVTVTGAGTSNLTTVEIVRAESYTIARPDEETHYGYEDELICLKQQMGESQISISLEDLEGVLDDGAKYKIVATVQDGIGQSSKAELEFEVHWTHQAVIPSASVFTQGVVAMITPTSVDAQNGDVCDIYRLSADKPELILKGGEFGQTYLDPYPAINGGYRVVYRTANGDYFTEDGTPAWKDVISGFRYQKTIIDFGTDRVELYYNVDSNNTWEKDFVEKKYLGGSVQGDWNPAISRSSSVSAITMNIFEPNTIQALRRLAEYAGICNVRTLDGSSYHANVNVSETNPHDKYGMISEFSLNITRVESQGYDAMVVGG